jgi:hypothetical protein
MRMIVSAMNVGEIVVIGSRQSPTGIFNRRHLSRGLTRSAKLYERSRAHAYCA